MTQHIETPERDGPFHEGELLAQQRAGESERGARNGRILGDEILGGAMRFLSQQSLLVLAHERPGPSGTELWCEVLVGRPGFLEAPDTKNLHVVRDLLLAGFADSELVPGERVGILAIELSTRRRLRINGRVVTSTDALLHIGVEESFPNCPKYIHAREFLIEPTGSSDSRSRVLQSGPRLGARQLEQIRRADTFFVASSHKERGLDASHRGGPPGFATVLTPDTLRIPDYDGNSMFNTIGNFVLDDRAGLTFLDFEQRQLLQMTGNATPCWDGEDDRIETGGTRRFWDFRVTGFRTLQLPEGFSWALAST